MRGNLQSMLIVASVLAIASILAWVHAYSSLTCYEALPRVTTWPPTVCDARFGMTFVFVKDSPANILAVLGVPAAAVALVLALTWQLIRRTRLIAATLFSFAAFLLLWGFLIWWLDRSTYQCAFGFGGFSCSGVIDNVALISVFLGWIAPVASLVCTPIVGRLARRRHDA